MKTNRDEQPKSLVKTRDAGPQPRLIPASRWSELALPWPSPSALRHLIHNAATNGFSRVIKKVGRIILIDVDAFHAWVDAQHSASLEAERRGTPRALSALEGVPHG